MESVSIVIPTWNGLELLKQFLPSVSLAAQDYARQSGAQVEILAVDDGSTDETVRMLINEGFTAHSETSVVPQGGITRRLIHNEKNSGFGAACNLAFRLASHRLVFLLNNDVEVDLDAIAPLVENFSEPDVFAVHCRVFDLKTGWECGTGKIGAFARGFIRVHSSYTVANDGAEKDRARHYSMFAGGGSAMFDRDKFLQIGGFEPLLAPFYWEDVELSYRAWKRGFVVLYEPRSVVRHRISSTIGSMDQRFVRRIQQRNRLIFHWINLHDPWLTATHLIWVTFLAITAPLRLQTTFLRSCVDALRLLPAIRKRREEEIRSATRTDRKIYEFFQAIQ